VSRKFHSLIEGVREHFRAFIVEHRLRRELRRPFGEGIENRDNRPQLDKIARFSCNPVIGDEPLVGAGENLDKKLSNAKRRELGVIWPPLNNI
jgi:hypothetical protein